jgi:hypothetical protein
MARPVRPACSPTSMERLRLPSLPTLGRFGLVSQPTPPLLFILPLFLSKPKLLLLRPIFIHVARTSQASNNPAPSSQQPRSSLPPPPPPPPPQPVVAPQRPPPAYGRPTPRSPSRATTPARRRRPRRRRVVSGLTQRRERSGLVEGRVAL